LKVKAIALFSGGLDSILATKIILDQGIDVQGVTFETPFFSAQKAIIAAKMLKLPLFIQDITEEHLTILKSPKYGYGKNMNPCIDCHTLMLKLAGHFMEEIGADFIITGEVLGQRPMSQVRQSLYVVAKNSGYMEFIVRPLSARLLPKTKPEMEGKIDRTKLFDIQGRGRKHQLALAQLYGITSFSPPAGGCLLTDHVFSRRLKDLFKYQKDFISNDIELLKFGRHFRINDTTKIIVGRNNADNIAIEKLYKKEDIIIRMVEFPGPAVLLPYGGDDQTLLVAASLCALYSDAPKDKEVSVEYQIGGKIVLLTTKAISRDDVKRWIIQ
jgi:tRNA U34 2-thiouridine synthase MnmA/TrmU